MYDSTEWDQFRKKNDIVQIPKGWERLTPAGQASIIWIAPRYSAQSASSVHGHVKKEINKNSEHSVIEKDTFFSGRTVSHPDPDGGIVNEEIILIYHIRNFQIMERKAFSTLRGFIEFNDGKALAEKWIQSK